MLRSDRTIRAVARLAEVVTYQSKIEPKRLQRVADLMQTFGSHGFVDERIDVSKMIVPTAPVD